MPTFPAIPADRLLKRLEHPGRKVRMVLDTDTFNEIDDQFAIVYALKSEASIQMEAIYAAPFHNWLSSGPADGMEKSYQEILKIRTLMNREDIPVFRGSTAYLPEADAPVESDAARHLVELAMRGGPDDPLYVTAIGAITNVASAILMEPRIIDRIVVVWLGGHALHWQDNKEFNLEQDVHGARVVFNSGVPLVLVPCMGAASHLQTTLSEIRDYVSDKGDIGRYLFETYRDVAKDHFAYSRVIWDVSAIAWIVNPAYCPSALVHSPLLSDDLRWSHDNRRHFIRCVQHVRRDVIFRDLFQKL